MQKYGFQMKIRKSYLYQYKKQWNIQKLFQSHPNKGMPDTISSTQKKEKLCSAFFINVNAKLFSTYYDLNAAFQSI